MKKAQVSVPFQWMYVLIAGAVILMLFITFVSRQKDSSEKQLSIEVTQKLNNIFTLTAQSTKTFNPQRMSPAELHFSCDKDDVSQYWIGKGSPESIETIAVFASSRIPIEKQLDTWTWPFDMPFSVMNVMFLSSPTITTFVVYDDEPFSETIRTKMQEDFPGEFNVIDIEIDDFTNERGYSLSTPLVRMIYLTDIQQLPPRIQRMPDQNVLAVRIGSERTATYYKKQGNQLIEDEAVAIIQTLDDPNPAFYGVFFSQNAEFYQCTMRKIFKRMSLLAGLYEARADEMKREYLRNNQRECELLVDPDLFRQLKQMIDSCDGGQSCLGQIERASEHISQRSAIISNQGCATLW
ncbi:MAG TPA: hypothetical protein VJB66_01970 [Candidatus Nanoarchaeia archaeon]|nr:hypothetical protein [Candidatus Nanoarchaeia archaeon]